MRGAHFARGTGALGDTGRLERRAGIDGLRAVAVAAVVAFHLDRFPGGNLGVDAFFVVSGWVITSSLLASVTPGRADLDLGSFWSARVRRLLPASAVALLAIAVVWSALDINVPSLRRDVLFALGWSANWGTITSGGDYWARFGEASPVGHFWSLAVEEQFYLVWPLILWGILRVGGRTRSVGWTALVLAGASVVSMVLLFDPANPTDTYLHTGARAHSLLFGAAAATVSIASRTRPWVGQTVRVAVLPAATAVVAILLLSDENSSWLYRWGFPTFAVGMAVVVMWVAEQRGGGVLGHPSLVWIGDRSYGIYLWHWPVILLLAPPRIEQMGPWRDIACVLLAIALAAISHQWLEQPIRRSERITWRWAPALVLATLVASTVVLNLGGQPGGERMAVASVVTLPPLPSTSTTDATTAGVAVGRTDGAPAPAPTTTAPPGPVRVLVVGDSTAVQLGENLMEQPAAQDGRVAVGVAAYGGCGLTAAADGRLHRSSNADGTEVMKDLIPCVGVWASARERITIEDIDVVLLSVWAMDGTDIELPDGEQVSVLDEVGRELVADAYRSFVRDVRAAQARVVWVVPPDVHPARGATLNDPARWEALRGVVHSLGVAEVDLPEWLADEDLAIPDSFTDGVHLTPEVLDRFVRKAVVPKLTSQSARAPHAG